MKCKDGKFEAKLRNHTCKSFSQESRLLDKHGNMERGSKCSKIRQDINQNSYQQTSNIEGLEKNRVSSQMNICPLYNVGSHPKERGTSLQNFLIYRQIKLKRISRFEQQLFVCYFSGVVGDVEPEVKTELESRGSGCEGHFRMSVAPPRGSCWAHSVTLDAVVRRLQGTNVRLVPWNESFGWTYEYRRGPEQHFCPCRSPLQRVK